MQVLKVSLTLPLYSYFDYFAPNDTDLNSFLYKRVLVQFGSRKLIGLVCDISEQSLPNKKIKSIIKTLDHKPLINRQLLLFYQWASEYYVAPIGEVIATAIPNFILTKERIEHNFDIYYSLNSSIDKLIKPTVQQQKIIKILKKFKEINKYIIQAYDLSKNSLTTLVKKNMVNKIINYNKPPNPNKILLPGPILNEEQKNILVDLIKNNLLGFKRNLIYGVTGSGKTELYIECCQHIIKHNQAVQILILVPEIGLIHQTVQKLKKRLNIGICEFSSGSTKKYKKDVWLWIKNSNKLMIIGTRSALFLPWQNLKLIVVDEEHDSSYKQDESNFRYNGRDLAIKLANELRIPIILGSATPSLESFYNTKKNKYNLYKVENKALGAKNHEVEIVDMNKKTTFFAKQTIIAIKEIIKKQHKVLIFLNRRGYAPVIYCTACQTKSQCPNCHSNMVYHQYNKSLICHQCLYSIEVFKNCPNCGQTKLKYIGAGTEKLEEELVSIFGKDKVIRIDRDNVKNPNRLNSLLQNKDAKILIGTQMIAQGHDLNDIQLVVVNNIDSSLYSSDIFALEKMVQTVFQVAGRSGRTKLQGKLILQTLVPEHKIIKLLCNSNYDDVLYYLFEERKKYNLPPLKRMAIIEAKASNPNNANSLLKTIVNLSLKSKYKIKIIGPMPSSVSKRKKMFQFNLIIIENDFKIMINYLKWVREISSKLKIETKNLQNISLQINIDPIHS